MSTKFHIQTSVLSSLAVALAAFSIAVAIAAMCHVQWIYYGVDPNLNVNIQSLQTVSRWRGMFVECPENSSATILTTLSNQKISPGCFNLNMQTAYDNDEIFRYLINMRRAYVAMFVSGLFCTTVGMLFFLGAICTWGFSTHIITTFRKISFFVGFLFIIAALSYIASMLVFHAELDAEKWYTSVSLPWIFSAWGSDVMAATEISYNVGYGLGWAACITTLLGGMLLWVNYCCIASHEESLMDSIPIVIDNGHDNSAFNKSNDFLHKNTGGYRYNGYNDDSAPQTLPMYSAQDIRAADQESHYSSKNVYRIY